jgi:two-component system chemotaxis family response regulator WspR
MTESSHPTPKMALSPDDYPIMVLLVDDQPMVGEAVRRMLADQSDIDFHFCRDPSQALKLVMEVRPTVILQDLVLPGVDGLELVSQYRANSVGRDIPIIVLSTEEEPLIKSLAFKTGANDYLVKLPDPIELVARIRYHSKAYLNQVQRDEAYRALRESQQQLLNMNIELQRLANVDGLTGLSNRKYFNDFLEEEWKRAMREHMPLAVQMIDVDDFKRYNDTYGHLAGDEVLKKVAEAIQRIASHPAWLTARFGGEEFSIIMPHTTVEQAQELGEKLCREIQALQIPHRGSTINEFMTASIGCAATIPHSGHSLLLLGAADDALYQAKKAGKNRVVTHKT